MNDRTKKLFSSLIFLSLIFTQTSNHNDILPRSASITEIAIVQGVGTDVSDAGNILLTVASKATSPAGSDSNSSDSASEKSVINFESGRTFFETINKIQSFSDKTILLNHDDVVVIGEAAAKKDLLSHIEYLYTAPKMRMDLLIFVAKGGTAQDVFRINSIGSETVSEKLVSLIDNVNKNAFVNRVTFYDIIERLEDDNQYSKIPAVEIVTNDTDETEKDIRIAGYAVFRRKKLLCYLSEEQSRALNILENSFERSPFVVDDKNFGLVTLEAFNIQTDIEYIPDRRNGSFQINIFAKANFAEQFGDIHSTSSPYNPDCIDRLEKSFENEIERQVLEMINSSKMIGADIAELSSAVKTKHPDIWQKIATDWNTTFKSIPVIVNADGKIVNFFTIHDQIGVDAN